MPLPSVPARPSPSSTSRKRRRSLVAGSGGGGGGDDDDDALLADDAAAEYPDAGAEPWMPRGGQRGQRGQPDKPTAARVPHRGPPTWSHRPPPPPPASSDGAEPPPVLPPIDIPRPPPLDSHPPPPHSLPPLAHPPGSDGGLPWPVSPWQGLAAAAASAIGVADAPADLVSPASNGRASLGEGGGHVHGPGHAHSHSHGHGRREEIPLARAASFFRTYFTVVHPQYPFLDTQQCSQYYEAWKESLSTGRLVGWPAFFVKMIFALGSLIESKNDYSPASKHQNLKSMAQAEQSIVADATSTPLVRLQAMLLSAMFALHAENTWRIVHISGVIMKFATVHRFHRLPPDADRDPAGQMAVRVWSCAYVLDRAVSSALGNPVSLPDLYISSPLYAATPEPLSPAPWLADCGRDVRAGSAGSAGSASTTAAEPDLRTFAHICRIRVVQSYFMHVVERDDLRHGIPPELETHMLQTLCEWEDSSVIARHSIPGSDGYRSPLWLQHIGHLTRLSICLVSRGNIRAPVADRALAAGCAACRTFRALQKKREIAQPWLVVLSQFRAAVTLWYIVWARAIPVPRDVSDSLRDCSAVLAIFAERWPKAEPYRDCFELLSTSVPRSQPLGRLSADARAALRVLTLALDQSGLHWVTLRMLREMGDDDEGGSEHDGG